MNSIEACLISATIDMIIPKISEAVFSFIVQACTNAVNVIMLNRMDSILNGNMMFFLFISVANELCGRRSTVDFKIVKIPMIVRAIKN